MRKTLISLIMVFAGLVAMYGAKGPEITFDVTEHDFNTFSEEKGKVTCKFTFTNTGSSDLILQEVHASCGCTTPEWTRHPIKAGGKGSVDVTFDSTNRPGAFNKTITVKTNAGEKRLFIKGEVIPKARKLDGGENVPTINTIGK